VKWTNPGHEYDAIGEHLRNIHTVYVYGLNYKDSQHFVFSRLGLKVVFIRVEPEYDDVWDSITIDDYYAIPRENQVVILSSFHPDYQDIKNTFAEKGYKRDWDYFVINPGTRENKLLEVFLLYVHDFLMISSLSLISTTVCNLNCRGCLNFTEYNKKQRHMSIDYMKRSIDLLFNNVDYVRLLHISGGEPLLHPNLDAVFSYLGSRYCENIGELTTSTNGTVIPSEELCSAMRDSNVRVIIDDYRPNVDSRADEVAEKFHSYGIHTTIAKVEHWIDLEPYCTDYSSKNEEWLREHFDNCACPWVDIDNGVLHSCNYAQYAEEAGISDYDECSRLDLSQKGLNKKIIYEFRTRFNTRGYLNFCKRCAGFSNNKNTIPPAVQV
jgi:hypothetical protein